MTSSIATRDLTAVIYGDDGDDPFYRVGPAATANTPRQALAWVAAELPRFAHETPGVRCWAGVEQTRGKNGYIAVIGLDDGDTIDVEWAEPDFVAATQQYSGGGLPWVYADGGRAAAGYRGETGDCVARSIAIVADKPYREVYDLLNEEAKRERPGAGRTRSSARTGMKKATSRRVLTSLGFTWTPTMGIGTGTTVHLRPGELPAGRLVVSCSRHLTAVIDGTVHDTHDPTRGGTRAVYGYWTAPARR